MGFIEVLSPGLVNRIAAGECVERPASVVKELVENALDAGAARIDVDILDGGRQLVRVTDDGVGMDADDLWLCVQPHATSKIHNDDDLFNIHTMGFRGEALASIGSIARVQVTSRPRDSDVAHTIRVEGGQVGEPAPCAGPPGTTVEVRDLFYCVPARRKFLRTNQTEMGHITEQFARLALAHPGVVFSLKHQKRVVHTLAATADRRQRIADFYGPELAEVLLPIRRTGDGVLVEGWVAPPKESRGSGKWEYVFVNGRYVRDKFVSHAVKEAYRSLIDPSRYPVAFLFVTIDPSQVDANVHPTKIEIRWRDSNYIHAQVLAALREKFLATNLDHTLQTQAAEDEAYRARVRQAMVDFFTRGGAAQSSALPARHEAMAERDVGTRGRRDEDIGSDVRTDASRRATEPRGREDDLPAGLQPHCQRDEGMANLGSEISEPARHPGFSESAIRAPQAPTTGAFAPPSLGPVPPAVAPRAIQLHNAFIVAETEQGLMIIDQHALHERILYEQLRARIAEQPLQSQRLLLPEAVRVPADRVEALETHAELLQRLGIELTPSGPHSVTLHAFPAFLERVNRERFVKDLLDLLNERGSRPTAETLIHDALDMMACKAAVKAGDPLTSNEIAALLARRELAERSSHCPHGRPTTLHLTLRDLERQFKRR
jgi:DNA mismatch repair protein MutL